MPQDTIPDGLHGPRDAPSLPASSFGAPAARRAVRPVDMPHVLDIRFTGSGSEYFRIWIVNLLLIVVTLGIYLPWAKVRRLKYFHGNTLVGDEPLGFHGNPRKMLRGYLLVGLMFLLYSVAGNFSPVAGLVALAIIALVAPALFRAAMQFRLANSSWRGMRFHFTGALLPVYLILLFPIVFFMVGTGVAFAVIGRTLRSPTGELSVWAALWIPLLFLAIFGVMLWTLRRLKKYQHDHYALGSLKTRLNASFGRFVGYALRLMGVSMLASVLVAIVVGGVASLFRFAEGTAANPMSTALLSLVPFSGTLLMLAFMKPYAATRLQNLVWANTGSADLQFYSDLRFRSMFGLTLRNWVLILLTLGLYWPFAAIAMARLRLEAVSVATREDPDVLLAEMRAHGDGAAGDAAGDLFGLDIGL